ncbi:MAG: GntR family transcriptional regulator [Propionibacteriaceae bacterium]|nr:GntR family transcriptional regulator [Propionibacteriaceae bacterium]
MLVVDPGLPTPPFEQIKQQIVAARESGEFPANHRLPPVRHLALELGVAPNTVARAYRELEASGVIQTRGRAGSFITGTADSAEKAGLAAARAYVATVEGLGLTASDALRLVRGLVAEA